jgi:hypothetical protein
MVSQKQTQFILLKIMQVRNVTLNYYSLLYTFIASYSLLLIPTSYKRNDETLYILISLPIYAQVCQELFCLKFPQKYTVYAPLFLSPIRSK